MSGPLRDRPERPRPHPAGPQADGARGRQSRARRPDAPDGPELLGLQRDAGNAAVARLVGQRQVALADLASAAPAPGATTTAHPVLRRGSTGDSVRELQTKLNAAGATPPLKVDGIFGPLTEGAVKAFQSGQSLSDDGVAGSQTWKALDTPPGPGPTPPPPPPPPPPPAHPTLKLGDQGPEVGVLQEKLNASIGTALPVTAVFDPGTHFAVILFQLQHLSDPALLAAVAANAGVVGPETWALLDKLAPGGGVVGGTEIHVEHPGGGHPLGVPIASLHPTVGPGNVITGPAVEELQQKLNLHRAGLGLPAIPEDANFTPATGAAVMIFQALKGLPLTTIADDATWSALDAEVGVGTVGYVERQWKEVVGGHEYSMTGASASRYSWRLGATSIEITAKVNFVGNPPSPQWPAHVANAWNIFKAVEETSGNELQINFNLVSGSGPDAHDVTVVAPPTTGRANAGQWFVADPNAASTIPHEFGHLIGLRDEYQQSAADYTQVTGHEAYVGAAAAADGASANLVATEQRNAITAKSSAQAFNSVTTHGIKEGAFAQSVVQEYASLNSGADLVKDLDVNLPADPAGGPINKYDTIQVFTYTSGSLMGDPSRHPDPHDHGVQPRHVMEFVEIIQKARGGTWKPMPR
jgi:peptidoglycan hydrolase-like protein with peptidoglycan-binding domain